MKRLESCCMALLLALSVANAGAQATNREIYLYRGGDRAERLAVEAKREGMLVLYSTMTLEDASPLLAAFEKKHGIKVKMWRAVNQKLVQRALAEARAGQLAADAFEGTGPGLEILHHGAAVAVAFEQPGEQEPAVGQLDRPVGVAEPLLEALLDQQLADGDRLQPAVEAEEDRPLLPWPVEQLGEQGGRLLPFGGGAGEPCPEAGEDAVPGGVLLQALLAGGSEHAQ